MVEMLVLRHGESEWNAERRWTGQADPLLSAAGRASTLQLAEELAEVGFGGVAASDLRRARETAQILADVLGLPAPRLVAGLRERDTGQWTGRTRAEIDRQWPGWLDRWRREELVELPEGEPRAAFDRRVLSALADVATYAGADPLLVVGHAGTLRALERHCAISARRRNLEGVWLAVEGRSVRPSDRGSDLHPPQEPADGSAGEQRSR